MNEKGAGKVICTIVYTVGFSGTDFGLGKRRKSDRYQGEGHIS